MGNCNPTTCPQHVWQHVWKEPRPESLTQRQREPMARQARVGGRKSLELQRWRLQRGSAMQTTNHSDLSLVLCRQGYYRCLPSGVQQRERPQVFNLYQTRNQLKPNQKVSQRATVNERCRLKGFKRQNKQQVNKTLQGRHRNDNGKSSRKPNGN